MRWTMWHVTGSGFDVADVEQDHLQDFLVNHLDTLSKDQKSFKGLIESLYQHPLWPITAEKVQELTDSGTAAEPISYIMFKETGIPFQNPGITDDGEDYVLYCASNPWDMTEKEKALSSYEEIKEIMEPYAEELGLNYEDDVDLIYAG